MNTINQSLNIALTEINQMLNDLRNASSFDEFNMVDNFLRGFAYGQLKQGILTQDDYDRLCSMIDVKVVKNSSEPFKVKHASNNLFTNQSFNQGAWNMSVPSNHQMQSVTHYMC